MDAHDIIVEHAVYLVSIDDGPYQHHASYSSACESASRASDRSPGSVVRVVHAESGEILHTLVPDNPRARGVALTPRVDDMTSEQVNAYLRSKGVEPIEFDPLPPID